MALELRQQLKMNQSLIMTPQLQQAIKILQLSRLELVEMVQTELMENPFLEESTGEDTTQETEEIRSEDAGEDVYDEEAAKSADWEDYLGEFASTPKQMQPREYEEAEDISSIEARYATRPTLESHLMWQLRLSPLTEEQMNIGEIIIGNLSSSGYLQAEISEIATFAECKDEEVITVLKIIQHFDPVGVAARSPEECLRVQLEVLNYDRDPVLFSLVTEHLSDLEARRYKPILRKFELEPEELKEYLDIIQSLDPMPGASFGENETAYISPDVYVYKHGDDFVILLNEDGLPHLQMSSLFGKATGATEAEKEYISEKQKAASWLVKSLFQRQRTLRRVMESLVKYQHDFFAEGIDKLRPLVLKDIADDIDMHPSTISRITSNKYVATAYGIFELKFFFNSGLEREDGSQVGSESVKSVIRKCISEEDAKEPLSDEQLSELLKEHLGVHIARRTVAKYRLGLNIPPSSQRRKHL